MEEKTENDDFLTKQIITYLGNKRTLISYIENEIKIIQDELGQKKTINVDLFSGSGVVGRMMKQYSSNLYSNDLEDYCFIINSAFLQNGNKELQKKIKEHVEKINMKIKKEEFVKNGIIYKNYAPTNDQKIKKNERVFYTSKNAMIIDTCIKYINNIPDEDIKKHLLAVLLSKSSIHNNTAGIFKGFYKNKSTGIGQFGGSGKYALDRIMGEINMEEQLFSNFNCNSCVTKMDAIDFAKKYKKLDIVYIDPPYNQHPYGSNYFMLNVICRNKITDDISKVSGIPKNWNRSMWNKKSQISDELDNLIDNLDSKYIILSYNSDGFLSEVQIKKILSKYGDVEVKEIIYNTYRGSRNLNERDLYVKEYLFILKKEDNL